MFDHDDVGRYLSSLDGCDRISKDREKELSDIIHNSDDDIAIKAAQDELVTSNLALVISVAKKYLNRPHGSLTFMDLIAEGNVGLIKASKYYDASHESGAAFVSYSHRSISTAIQRAINASGLVRVPDYIPTCRYKAKLMEEEGLSDEEIVSNLKISQELLWTLREGTSTVSFEKIYKEDGLNWEDRFEKDDSCEPAKPDVLLRDLMSGFADHLSEIEQGVVKDMYYGPYPMTYLQLSKKYGKSRERMRQIHFKCLHKLRVRVMTSFGKATGKYVRTPHKQLLEGSNGRINRGESTFQNELDLMNVDYDKQRKEYQEYHATVLNHFIDK